MSNEAVRRIREAAEGTIVDATWAQWSVLTAAAVRVGRKRVWTIVDPEALVLASFAVGHLERRLEDMVASWAMGAAYLMSVQRMRTLASRSPEPVEERLGDFARAAVGGGDKRWRRLASTQTASEYTPRVKPLGPLRLIEGPALTLRLRAGFGVNAKADILSLLLGFEGAAADLKVIAAATAYSERAIRTATKEMSLAGFIHEIEGRPSSFHAEAEAWAQVLRTHRDDWQTQAPAVPRWRFWAAVFEFLAGVIDWAGRAHGEGWSTYVASSRARDLVENHSRQLRQAELDVRRPASARGAEYMLDFEDLVLQVQRWTNDSLYGR